VVIPVRTRAVIISNSGVWRILKRVELNRLPASQRYQRRDRRWKRYEKPLPGHRVQIDVKFIQPLPAADGAPPARTRRRFYQFTAIDDCTRLRVLRLYPALNQKTAIQFVDYVLERLPFRVEVIQTDNGADSSPRSTGTCWTRASTTPTSSRAHPGSTAKSNAPTASTPRSSTASSSVRAVTGGATVQDGKGRRNSGAPGCRCDSTQLTKVSA
jgi:hypothetical protein